MKLRAKPLALLTALLLVVAACGGDTADTTTTAADGATTTAADGETTTTGAAGLGGTVSVFGAPTGDEGAAIQQIIDEHINAEADYVAEYEGSDSFEEQMLIRIQGGNPDDIALYPQPGSLVEQAQQGTLIALEDLGFDIAELEATFGSYLLSLGEVDGKHYGLPTNTNLKSLIWYNKPAFEAAGYQIPATWDELMALAQQVVDDGTAEAAFCVGFGSDAATGWPGTDWIEDIMLRTAGPDVYDQWVNNEVGFTSPEVRRAFEVLGEAIFPEGFVLGGAENIPSIDFRDAPDPMFNDPPGCMFHRQASFITTFFPEGVEADVDYGVFAFPDIDEGKKGGLGAGELAAVFSDRPEVRDFLQRFISDEVQCAQGSILGGGRISPNLNVGSDCYANPILATSAQAIVDALAGEGFRFDASDLMPQRVGSGAFWTGMIEYAEGGPDNLDQILTDIDASW
jgi:alpha-glucoside transport system substrate-binding protein